MAPSVRPDGRPSRGVCKNGPETGRTAHFRAVGVQRAGLTPGVQPVAPTSIGWRIWPAIDRARPCACHRTITHVTAAAVGVCWHHPRPERPRLAPCHRWCRTCHSPIANSLLGFLIESARVGPRSRRGILSTIMKPLKSNPVPLGASQIPTHKPSRRCVAVV